MWEGGVEGEEEEVSVGAYVCLKLLCLLTQREREQFFLSFALILFLRLLHRMPEMDDSFRTPDIHGNGMADAKTKFPVQLYCRCGLTSIT